MKNVIKVFTLLTLVFMSTGVNAQNMKVTGTVYDTTGTQPLYQAMIMAVRVKDSLLLGFTRTNKNGEFSLTGFPVDTFTMVISHPRFDDKNIYIFGSPDNVDINIPTVKMPSKAKELEEIMIYANKNPIFYKGDTLVYVADSFKVAEGAVVEDLLKKLPGIKIDKDGKITSQGQEINKVLVDGDEFFGSDPTVATKNLGADGVEQVQIYEKTDNETIGGSDEKIKVLDLKLKEEAKKGYFGRVSGASDLALTPLGDDYTGTKPFYEGELLFNKFSSREKISVFALGSNTPRSNFGRGDLNKFGLSNENGANRNFWEPDNNNNNSGIPQTFKAGVYYSNKFGKKQNNTETQEYEDYIKELKRNLPKKFQPYGQFYV
ncbi:MAG: carboxypeptidase regulatory-like domain-containing protein, partial [Flavobacteriia bacterium]